MRAWVLLLILGLAAACESPTTEEAGEEPIPSAAGAVSDDKLFPDGTATCTYLAGRHYANHEPPFTNLFSRDGRWFARTSRDHSLNTIELYDNKDEKKYLIYHPNYQLELTNLSFSTNSNHLSFIATPWGAGGISEIYGLNLTTFVQSRFGDVRGSYRHPQIVSDAGDMLFYQASGGPAVPSMPLLKLAGKDRLGFWLGYLDPDGRVSFMLKYDGNPTGFMTFDNDNKGRRESYEPFEEFVSPMGLLAGNDPGEYFAFHSWAYKISKKTGAQVSSVDEVTRVRVVIDNNGVFAVDKGNADRLQNLHALRPLHSEYEIPAEFLEYPEEKICFEIALI